MALKMGHSIGSNPFISKRFVFHNRYGYTCPLLELPILSITANLRLGIRSKKIAESQS